jgi:hypothetical protein
MDHWVSNHGARGSPSGFSLGDHLFGKNTGGKMRSEELRLGMMNMDVSFDFFSWKTTQEVFLSLFHASSMILTDYEICSPHHPSRNSLGKPKGVVHQFTQLVSCVKPQIDILRRRSMVQTDGGLAADIQLQSHVMYALPDDWCSPGSEPRVMTLQTQASWSQAADEPQVKSSMSTNLNNIDIYEIPYFYKLSSLSIG